MAKAEKSENIDLSDDQLQKLANMVGSMKNNVSIIKVGNDVSSSTEMVERYKKSNQQLRSKIERNITEIVKLEAEIRELEADAYLNTDEGMEGMIKKLKEQKKDLKGKLERADDAADVFRRDLKELKDKNYAFRSIETKLKKDNKELKGQNKELNGKVEELQAEVDIRIEEDSRFNNMDL